MGDEVRKGFRIIIFVFWVTVYMVMPLLLTNLRISEKEYFWGALEMIS